MGKDVFVVADNVLTPLGKNTAENFKQLKKNISGVKEQNKPAISPKPFFASLFSEGNLSVEAGRTKFENVASLQSPSDKRR